MKNNKFERGVEVVVGLIIVNSKRKIFLAKSPKWQNKWILPGGHIDPGETIKEASLREAKEETGLDVRFSDVINYGEVINSKEFHRPVHLIYFDVLCKVKEQEVKIDGVELTDYGWFSPKEALKIKLAVEARKDIKEYIKFLQKK